MSIHVIHLKNPPNESSMLIREFMVLSFMPSIYFPCCADDVCSVGFVIRPHWIEAFAMRVNGFLCVHLITKKLLSRNFLKKG